MKSLHPDDLAELAYDEDPNGDWRAELDPNLDIVPEITDQPASGEESF
ncbi:hypothetical protein ACFWYW_58885 [Nonomuraea sp. NPDC059023]